MCYNSCVVIQYVFICVNTLRCLRQCHLCVCVSTSCVCVDLCESRSHVTFILTVVAGVVYVNFKNVRIVSVSVASD